MADDALKRGLEILESVRTVRLNDSSGQYENILKGLLSDLESPNTLSVIFCEQMAECLYWLRKHTEDKETIILESIAEQLDKALGKRNYAVGPFYNVKDVKAILAGTEPLTSETTQALLDRNQRTLEDCRALAFVKRAKDIQLADDLIQRQRYNLRHLQKSLESIHLQKRLLKRMDLELHRLEKEVYALDHEPETKPSK